MIIQKLLLEYAKQHPFLLFLNVLFMGFVPFNEVLLPYLYGKVVNSITNMSGVEKILGITVIAVIAAQLGYIMRDKLNEVFIPSFESFLKVSLVDKVLDKYHKNFSNITTGDIIYRLTVIPDIIVVWFQWINDYIIPYLVTFLIAIVYFFRFDKTIGICFMVFVLVLVYLFTRAPEKCLDVARAHSHKMAEFHEHLEELINNMVTVYSTNTKNQEIMGLKDLAETNYFSMYPKTSQCARKYKIYMIPVIAVLISILVMRSKQMILEKKIKPQAFVTVFFILTSMLASILWIVDAIKYGVFDLGKVSDVNHALQITQENDRPRMVMGFPAPVGPMAIGLQNVTFGYNGHKVLDNYSVGFERGERTVIVGPVGRGKSTLIKLLLGFYVPEQGDAYLEGKWYGDMSLADVRRSIGYIPQQPVLFNNTVLYNVRYGNEHLTEKDVVDFITKHGVQLVLDKGVDTHVGKNGNNLSGGQRQLIWCLRVMLQNPDILIMDEPTASMDDRTKDVMLRIMDSLMEGKTVIFVSHDPYLISKGTKRVEVL